MHMAVVHLPVDGSAPPPYTSFFNRAMEAYFKKYGYDEAESLYESIKDLSSDAWIVIVDNEMQYALTTGRIGTKFVFHIISGRTWARMDKAKINPKISMPILLESFTEIAHNAGCLSFMMSVRKGFLSIFPQGKITNYTIKMDI